MIRANSCRRVFDDMHTFVRVFYNSSTVGLFVASKFSGFSEYLAPHRTSKIYSWLKWIVRSSCSEYVNAYADIEPGTLSKAKGHLLR